MKTIFKSSTLLACLTFASVITPSSVMAHAVLAESSALAGSYYKGAVRIGHGCDGSPTTGVKLFIPAGFEGAKFQIDLVVDAVMPGAAPAETGHQHHH